MLYAIKVALLTYVMSCIMFRIPAHKDCHLLDMSWTDVIYIDTCLPFGLHSAPKLFNIMADLLAGILQQQEVTELLHYFDNFITIAPPPPMSFRCQQNLDTIKRVCTHLGVGLCQICQHIKSIMAGMFCQHDASIIIDIL